MAARPGRALAEVAKDVLLPATGAQGEADHAIGVANGLDALFLVPSAAVTLQTGIGLEPAGTGSVCFRAAEGAAFRQMQSEVVELAQYFADRLIHGLDHASVNGVLLHQPHVARFLASELCFESEPLPLEPTAPRRSSSP